MVLFATIIALLAGTAYFKLRNGSSRSIFYSFLDSVMFIPYTLRIGPFAAHDNGIERTCIDAMKSTGLNDFDDSGKFSFMKLYAMSHDFGYVRSKCLYSPMGFLVQKFSQRRRMEIRLLMVDYFKRHPSVETTTFSRPPIIITGFTRTGTTFLHELLSIHPETRAHNTWEQVKENRYNNCFVYKRVLFYHEFLNEALGKRIVKPDHCYLCLFHFFTDESGSNNRR